MLHKARARNARPYGHGGVMRSSFFRNIVGARIARPLLEFVQNFGFAHLLYGCKNGAVAEVWILQRLHYLWKERPIRREDRGRYTLIPFSA